MMGTVGLAKSEPGSDRVRNEDRFHVDDERGLYAVCDGLGGHPRGDWAADLAVSTVVEQVREHDPTFEAVTQGEAPLASAEEALKESLRRTNDVVYQRTARLPARLRHGTTLTVLRTLGDHAVVADVGDSRVYHWRDGQAAQLTHDDTLAQSLTDVGALPMSDPVRARYDSVLTQAVGIEPEVTVETRLVPLRTGDRFLLCSDGLKPYLDGRADLGRRLACRLDHLPERLIELAKDAGSGDNLTALVVEVAENGAG